MKRKKKKRKKRKTKCSEVWIQDGMVNQEFAEIHRKTNKNK